MAILIKDSSNNVIFSDTNAPSGAISVKVVATSRQGYILTPPASGSIGGLSGRASASWTRTYIGVGNVKLRGEATTEFIPSVTGNVRIGFGGQIGGVNQVFVIPKYAGSVTSILKGEADVDFLPSVDGNVKVRFVGQAGVVLIPSVEGRVSGTLSGRADVYVLKAQEGDVEVRFRGTASAVVSGFRYIPTGGLLLDSGENKLFKSSFDQAGDGSLAFTGLARVRGGLASIMSGAVAFTGLSGNAGYTNNIVNVSTGKLSLSGQSVVAVNFFYGTGGTVFSGVATTTQGYFYAASGGMFVGAIGVTSSSVNFDASGSIGLSGDCDLVVTDTFSSTFLWKLHEKVEFSKEFTWGVGERPFSFYRVTGKCKPARCPPVQVNGCSEDSKFTYVVNIYARNLSEVCRKLRDRNMIFPIATIEKFSTPASKLDYTDDTKVDCNKLIPVTPPITFLPCQDLMVDFNAKSNIGVSMKVAMSYLIYEGSGRLGMTGGVYPFDFRFYEASVDAGVSGEATCVQKDYSYIPTGSIGFAGAVENLTLPVWVFQTSGGLSAGIDGPVWLVQQQWFMEPTGGLAKAGSWDGTPTMDYAMSGGVTKGESSALSEEDFLPFITEMAGGLGVGGPAPAMPGEYYYEPSGSFGYSGLTHFLTPHLTIQPQGRLRLSNGLGSVPNTSSNRGGAVGMGGTAPVSWSPLFIIGVKVGLSGAAGVSCSTVVPSGRLGLSGAALVRASDLGEIAMPFAADFSVKSETVLFAYDDAPAALRPARRITSRCCTQSLPLRLWVEHPLARGNHFRHFLQRNNLLIDNPVEIYYNATEKMWYNTLHFEGFAPDFPTIEAWTITFGWSCSSSTSDSTTFDDSDLYWKFSMMANLRSVNNPTIPQRVSKIVAGFNPSRVCFNNKMLSFPFIVNTSTKAVNPASIQTLVYVDDAGMFKSPEFIRSPEIRFKVSEIVADIPQAVVDIGPVIANSQLVGANAGSNILSSLPTG